MEANFARYDLPGDQVVFLEGFFEETLGAHPFGPLAVARLDGDMYSSTIVALYTRLSPGGFLIVDDYGAIASCRQPVNDYRDAQGIG